MTHVAYGINDKYLPPLLVSLFSVLKTTPESITVSVFTVGPNSEIRENIERLSSCFRHSEIEIREFDPNQLEAFEKTKVGNRYSTASIIPLFLPWLVDGKCLFLDADTLILHDISKLYETDLGGSLIGACQAIELSIACKKYHSSSLMSLFTPVRSRQRRRELRAIADDIGYDFQELQTSFFCSGTILMDTKAIRATGPLGNLMNLEATKHILNTWADMGLFNACFKNKTHFLNLKWSVHRDFSFVDLLYLPARLRAEAVLARRNPGLLHYPNLYGRHTWRRPWYRSRKRYRLYKQFCKVVENETEIPIFQMFEDRNTVSIPSAV